MCINRILMVKKVEKELIIFFNIYNKTETVKLYFIFFTFYRILSRSHIDLSLLD